MVFLLMIASMMRLHAGLTEILMQLFFSYTRIQKICISVFALGAFMAVCLGFGVTIKPGKAEGSCPAQAFYIKGIDVAVDDESSEIARIKATTQAQQKAWQALQSRLLLLEQPFIADNASIIDSVLDYIRIDQETVLETRYQGRFDYCFDRVKTRALFKDQGIRHAELISGDMLVLPVWNEAKPRGFGGNPTHGCRSGKIFCLITLVLCR